MSNFFPSPFPLADEDGVSLVLLLPPTLTGVLAGVCVVKKRWAVGAVREIIQTDKCVSRFEVAVENIDITKMKNITAMRV